MDYVISYIGLCDFYEKDSCGNVELCIENLDELVNVVSCFEFMFDDIDVGFSELVVFFLYVVLEVGEG